MTERESLGSSRLIEIIAVLVLGITTLGTAWCSYEAYQWNSQQSSLAQQTTSAELNANRLFGLATQKVTYDSSLLADYATAYRANDTKLMQFYRQSLMRPQLLPYLDAWVADVQAGKAPQNLLSDPAYLDPVMADYTAAAAQGGHFGRAEQGGRLLRRPLPGDDHPVGGRAVLRRGDLVVPLDAGEARHHRLCGHRDRDRREPPGRSSGAVVMRGVPSGHGGPAKFPAGRTRRDRERAVPARRPTHRGWCIRLIARDIVIA